MSLQSGIIVLEPVSFSPAARALPARRESWAGPAHANAHACSHCPQEIGALGVKRKAELAWGGAMISSSTSANAEARAAVGGDDARRARAIARRSASRKPHAACASALVRRVGTCMAMQPCLAGGTSTLSANANVATRGVSAAACGDRRRRSVMSHPGPKSALRDVFLVSERGVND